MNRRPLATEHHPRADAEKTGDKLDWKNAPPTHDPLVGQYPFDFLNSAAGRFGRKSAHHPHRRCRKKYAGRHGHHPSRDGVVFEKAA
jgi:hypothetical protein